MKATITPCKCKLCRWSRSIEKIKRKLPKHDQLRFNVLVGAIWDENEAMSMDLCRAREELKASAVVIERQRRGEFICVKCGLRKDGDAAPCDL